MATDEGVRPGDTVWPERAAGGSSTSGEPRLEGVSLSAQRYGNAMDGGDRGSGGRARARAPQMEVMALKRQPSSRTRIRAASIALLWLAFAASRLAAHPLSNPRPASNILPPGTSSIDLTVSSAIPTSCRYAVGADRPYAQMTPFAFGAGTTTHNTPVSIDPDPKVVNEVFVRCAAVPDSVLHLMYRARADVDPGYPRIGNLWGWSEWKWEAGRTPAEMAKVDLWLGVELPDISALDDYRSDFEELRELNPDILILTSMNAVEPSTDQIPESYYLHDVNGDRIEVWPGSYRLNLTRAEVADFQAQWAYQKMAEACFIHDGIFIDNVFLSQSWETTDMYGNPVEIDADEDGVPDDPEVLDAAWRSGVLLEIETIRALMPSIVMTGHALEENEPRILAAFNGVSVGFEPADVIEAEQSYSNVDARYGAWSTGAREPRLPMYEGSPIDLFAYGYGYDPFLEVRPSALAFARDYYPWMRFGLGLTLMRDGHYAYEWGDTYHGNAWWYDEYDFDLGRPTGAAQYAAEGFDPGPNLIVNPGFEDAIEDPWTSWVDSSSGYEATITRDATVARVGAASARIDVTLTSGEDWCIDFHQDNRSLVSGTPYSLTFWAKASLPRPLTVMASKNAPDWDQYGLYRVVSLTADWQEIVVPFVATATADDARIQFQFGAAAGTVWLDEVRLTRRAPDVYRRDFTNGTVLLNATDEPQTIAMGAGYKRFAGGQAPRAQAIVDDGGDRFSVIMGTWIACAMDSGEWEAAGPYYHSFGDSAHWIASGAGEARWTLPVDGGDTYTVSVWYPAAPESSSWTSSARYDLLVNGVPVTGRTLSQRTGGDSWHSVGSVTVGPGASLQLRLTCTAGRCVADAVYVESASRYNDGAAATAVTLQPFDAILLRLEESTDVPLTEGVGPLRVLAATPNPARLSLRFSIDLPSEGQVVLRIFDISGRLVAEPLRACRPAGPGIVEWDLRGSSGHVLPAGVYAAELRSGSMSVRRRFVIVH